MATKKILIDLEIDGSAKASSTVEGKGGNLRSYGGDVAFDAFQGYDGIRELATDEYVIPFLGAPHIEGQGNLGAGTTNSRAGVSTYIETAKYNFTTNDQIPYGVMWVRRAGKALISLIAKTKDEAASHISSRLKVGYTPTDNYGDQTNTNVLDVNGNIHAVSSVSASSFIKDGGTSSQFLKADGSVDSSTYLTSASTQSKYLRSDVADSTSSKITLGNVHTQFGSTNDPILYTSRDVITLMSGGTAGTKIKLDDLNGYAIVNAQFMMVGSSSNPDAELEIRTSVNPVLRLTSEDTSVLTGESIGRIEMKSNDASLGGNNVMGFIDCVATNAGTTYALKFGTGTAAAATAKMTILQSGYVGILDETPSFPLDVNGAIRGTGNITGGTIIKQGGTSSQFLKADGSVDSKDYIQAHEVPYTEQIALSDETTALTTGTSKVTFRSPGNITASLFRLSCATAPTGSVITVDINVEGVSILSTKLTIDAGEKTSRTAVTAMQFVTGADVIGNDNEITIDIDGVGSTIAGAGLKLIMYYNYSVVLP